MSGRADESIDAELASWNDAMYRQHATPYDRSIAGRIQWARVRAVLRLANITAADAVLEIGCEAGRLLSRVPRCRRLVGVDISSVALADAGALLRGQGRTAELRQMDAGRPLPFTPGEFDVVICSEMLEHTPRPRRVLEHIHAAVEPSTRVVLTVPLEAPKVAIKKALTRLGLMRRLFPGIESGGSEWHVQDFSRALLAAMTADLFERRQSKLVWGCHYAVLVAKR